MNTVREKRRKLPRDKLDRLDRIENIGADFDSFIVHQLEDSNETNRARERLAECIMWVNYSIINEKE